MTDTTNPITINTIPALTWNWLKMNDAQISLASGGHGKAAFVTAKPEIRNLTDEVTYSEDVKNFSLPNVGAHNQASGESRLCETGAGVNADVFFDEVSPSVYYIEKNKKVEKPIIATFDLKDGSQSACQQIIHAKENASVTVVLLSMSEKSAGGFEAIRTYCVAEKNAHIHLVKVQMLGSGFTQVDDTGAVCAENASVSVTQIMLGAAKCYAGVAATLSEYAASFKSDTAYLCMAEQLLDMNYVVRHIAKKTECKMSVAGTLRDKAQKTYRGTIDFIKGCSGSKGEETEETLLLSPAVTNKSIPLILCDEEDVAGEHGASIGRLSEDVLFYMQSRGISKATAEDLMARAKIDAVAQLIPDCQTRARIEAFLD